MERLDAALVAFLGLWPISDVRRRLGVATALARWVDGLILVVVSLCSMRYGVFPR